VKAELRSIEAADHFFADGSGLADLCEVVSVYLCGHL
jgi:hypothetical protein